jgi:predicted kinase
MKAIITVGISASGKSHWANQYAREHNAIVAERDNLRFTLTGHKDWSTYKFDKKFEGMVTVIQYSIIREAYRIGRDIVISDTNLNPKTRVELFDFCNSLGYTFEYKVFNVVLEHAIARDMVRERPVGRTVIEDQYKRFIEQGFAKQ